VGGADASGGDALSLSPLAVAAPEGEATARIAPKTGWSALSREGGSSLSEAPPAPEPDDALPPGGREETEPAPALPDPALMDDGSLGTRTGTREGPRWTNGDACMPVAANLGRVGDSEMRLGVG
jgi:hypothetical protein